MAASFRNRRQHAILVSPFKYFCSAKPAPLPMNSEVVEAEQKESTHLEFVRGQGNLSQVFRRTPDDGFFPAVKHHEEMEAEDVPNLIKANLSDVIKQVINRENELEPSLSHALISHLHDKDGRLIESIYDRLLRDRLARDEKVGNYMRPLHYNMMIQSAAVYKR